MHQKQDNGTNRTSRLTFHLTEVDAEDAVEVAASHGLTVPKLARLLIERYLSGTIAGPLQFPPVYGNTQGTPVGVQPSSQPGKHVSPVAMRLRGEQRHSLDSSAALHGYSTGDFARALLLCYVRQSRADKLTAFPPEFATVSSEVPPLVQRSQVQVDYDEPKAETEKKLFRETPESNYLEQLGQDTAEEAYERFKKLSPEAQQRMLEYLEFLEKKQ